MKTPQAPAAPGHRRRIDFLDFNQKLFTNISYFSRVPSSRAKIFLCFPLPPNGSHITKFSTPFTLPSDLATGICTGRNRCARRLRAHISTAGSCFLFERNKRKKIFLYAPEAREYFIIYFRNNTTRICRPVFIISTLISV